MPMRSTNISQEDMKSMCQEAVNRAALYIAIEDDTDLKRAFAIHAINGTEWDESEMTEELYQMFRNLNDDEVSSLNSAQQILYETLGSMKGELI